MEKRSKHIDNRMRMNSHNQYFNFMRENQMFHRKTLLYDANYKNYIENVRDDLNEGKKENEKDKN